MNKKFALLLVLLAAMVMGSVASASAAEVKATGSWTISAEWTDRTNFNEIETNTFAINQRARTAFHFIANENLKAVLNTQIGTGSWGSGLFGIGAGRSASTTAAGSASAGAGNIMLREGYVQFAVPGTKALIKAGFQGLSLPSAVGGGSAIFDDQIASVAAIVPVMDSLSLVGGYGRAVANTTTAPQSSSSFDVAFLYGDVKFNGVNLQPFVAYGYDGARSGGNIQGFQTSNSTNFDGARAYFGGIAATIDIFNPIKIMADFNYGKATLGGTNTASRPATSRAGWMFDLQVDYTGLSMMTPSLVFAYSSGENGNSTQKGGNKSERMPVIGSPQNYAIGSFWMQGSNSLNADGLGGTTQNNLGFWVAGLQLKDIKFIDKLTHTLNVLYFKGTNDVDYLRETNRTGTAPVYGQFLTTKDSLWEVDLNTKYQVYSELAAHLELGWISPSFNKTAWAAATSGAVGGNQGNKDAYKVAAIVNYSF